MEVKTDFNKLKSINQKHIRSMGFCVNCHFLSDQYLVVTPVSILWELLTFSFVHFKNMPQSLSSFKGVFVLG